MAAQKQIDPSTAVFLGSDLLRERLLRLADEVQGLPPERRAGAIEQFIGGLSRRLAEEMHLPFIAIPVQRNGHTETRFFAGDEAARAVFPIKPMSEMPIGAWADLDWDEMIDALDRIRHESVPTPPIDDCDDW